MTGLFTHLTVHPIGTHQDNHALLVAHRLVELLPVRVILIPAGPINLAEQLPDLFGVRIIITEQSRLALDGHPAMPGFRDGQYAATRVAAQVSDLGRFAVHGHERGMPLVRPADDDARVRRALNLAVDKQLLVDSITQGGQMPAWSYVPPYTGSGYAEQHEADLASGNSPFTGPEFRFNPELGRKLLAEAGYKVVEKGSEWHAEGFPSLEILYNTSEGHKQIAVAIQAMWREHLGITVALRNEEWKVMLKNLRDGRFQIARFGWIADYNHPHTYADLLTSVSHHNWTHWKSPEYDALVSKAAATADQTESIKLYRQAELLSLTDMPRMPLYFYTKSTLIKPYVKGYWPNASNDHFIRWLWIDENWRDNPDNVPSYPPREVPEPGRIAP